jgi:hypothetical protein
MIFSPSYENAAECQFPLQSTGSPTLQTPGSSIV